MKTLKMRGEEGRKATEPTVAVTSENLTPGREDVRDITGPKKTSFRCMEASQVLAILVVYPGRHGR